MVSHLRMTGVIAAILSATVILSAQGSQDPSGHWQGAVSAPGGEIRFELDLQKNASGGYDGSVDIPGQKISGLPLREVAVNGKTIEFDARTDQSFRGEIADDGQSMAGTFSVEGATLPFSITRTGSARVHSVAKGSPITRALEGTWTATIPANGGKRLALRLASNSDGTSSAVMTNVDEGGLQIPGTATQKGSSLTIELAAIDGAYAATLNDDGNELVGTYTQGDRSIALTFLRDMPRK